MENVIIPCEWNQQWKIYPSITWTNPTLHCQRVLVVVGLIANSLSILLRIPFKSMTSEINELKIWQIYMINTAILLLSNITDSQFWKMKEQKQRDSRCKQSGNSTQSIKQTSQRKGTSIEEAPLTHFNGFERWEMTDFQWLVIWKRPFTNLNGYKLGAIHNSTRITGLFSVSE